MIAKYIYILCIFILYCYLGAPIRNASAEQDPVYYVSLVNVLVNPGKFDGKRIAVVGYLGRPHNPYLYLTKNHASLNDITSAIPVFELGLQESECMNRFVRVVGRFGDAGNGDYGIQKLENVHTNREIDSIKVSCWQS